MKRVKRLAVLTALTAVTGLAIAAGPALAAGTFTVSAHTTFDRSYTWAIDKTAHNPALVLAKEESFDEVYDVKVTNTGFVDSNWTVQDGILYQGDGPFTPTSVTAVIQPGNIPATVDCPAGLFGSTVTELYCSYGPTNLPTGTPGTVTVTVNYLGGSASTTRNYNFTTDLLANEPTESQKCVNATDSFFGPLGTVCVADSPKTFTYTRTIGPYHDCGEFTVENTASLDDDLLHPSTDSATVHVSVPCAGGCTLTQGYWKTHSKYGPASKADPTWNLLPGGAGPDTTFFLSGASWFNVFWTAPAGNAYYNLAHQYMAARLNILGGATAPAAVTNAIASATALFGTYTPAQIGALSSSNALRKQFVALAGTLGSYNEGTIGPGHCSE